ncbi:MAG TPA: YtxH domain-containing protein [Pyrinomonadaceae bacterium]|nr:YtxH domain-containing protein [Pyrinomonadaceae bacterium]
MHSSSDTQLAKNTAGRNVAFFLIGGSLGAAAALLLAPKTGKDLRHDIATTAKTGYDGAVDLVDRVKDGSSSIYHSIIDRSNQVLDLTGDKLVEAKDAVLHAVDAGQKRSNEVRTEAREKFEEKVSAFRIGGNKRRGSARRSSSVV